MQNNEPAFPQERMLPDGSHEECEGLSIRDYFAAKAMQAILSNDKEAAAPDGLIAKGAYEMADAMMKARKQ